VAASNETLVPSLFQKILCH